MTPTPFTTHAIIARRPDGVEYLVEGHAYADTALMRAEHLTNLGTLKGHTFRVAVLREVGA
jgi:hypothetical protein